MGARLVYAKVIDRNLLYDRGGRIEPGLHSLVVMDEEPGEAGAFLVARAWTDDEGTLTERWSLESPAGQTVYEGVPRELHLPTRDHVEAVQDEVSDLKIDYAAEDYTLVLSIDENEVARVDFPIRVGTTPAMNA